LVDRLTYYMYVYVSPVFLPCEFFKFLRYFLVVEIVRGVRVMDGRYLILKSNYTVFWLLAFQRPLVILISSLLLGWVRPIFKYR
jgi:hypothetical protein